MLHPDRRSEWQHLNVPPAQTSVLLARGTILRDVQTQPRLMGRSNGFWPIEAVLKVNIGGATEGLAICTICAAIVLASDKSKNLHREFHR
jgi:hypothetical protein